MTTVLIVDDDPLVRAGLTLILGGAPDLEVVAEAADGAEGVTEALRHRPDVVLMDIRMPGMNGLEATARLEAEPSPPKVIVLTTFDADEYVVQALAAGASGFLLKDTPPPQIVDAVRKVASGEPMLSPSVTAQLIRQVARGAGASSARASDARQRLAVLTDRETEVAVAVGRGLSNAEISRQLHMSVPTVKAHISRLFTKLEVHNRVQIAICVHDAELV
ncbi:MAG TPA: response regulator transcription factor [Nocardioidaceae bacterium]|nr:response regulator transcription factor [Nocardioidaceae bacterium]